MLNYIQVFLFMILIKFLNDNIVEFIEIISKVKYNYAIDFSLFSLHCILTLLMRKTKLIMISRL